MSPLVGKVIAITGGAGGIGESTARTAYAQGASVVITDREAGPVEAIAQSLGERAVGLAVDVTRREDNERMVATALERFGRLDGVFLNAGIEGEVGPFDSRSDAAWEKVFAVNVHGVRLGAEAALPALRRGNGGSIVITSSVAGLRGAAGLSPYVSSKHAVVGMMKCLAAELGPENIRVNTLNPGPVANRMMQSIEEQANPGHADEVHKSFEARIPLGRYVSNEECAGMAVFLLSDAASGCTGNTYVVDGGLCSQ
ncbi:short-chain dehydrogenase/reductase SDR [Thioalkalivibrio sp. K90mix]|uniref:SDR family NAD(P)-dependent oxidoreductase n=1 Tax=unclassified Thioalkalivibrio TaxID=2621013 RepID=UPI000195967C|nr:MULTISPECIES: SDR family oxidoreductase [unclassified Thioalkalivibrio]ADC72574.1 short-chain dehydrogenase/reductase SDR [Thioalkalivibrio sp. K90mix]